jgi:hypothetical protein
MYADLQNRSAESLGEAAPTFGVRLYALDLRPADMAAKLVELAGHLEADFICALTSQGRQASFYFHPQGPFTPLQADAPATEAIRARAVTQIRTAFGVETRNCTAGWTPGRLDGYPFVWTVQDRQVRPLHSQADVAVHDGRRWALTLHTETQASITLAYASPELALRAALELGATAGLERLELHVAGQ